MAIQGMVHALERAREHLVPGGALVCIQPHRTQRPFISVVAPGQRDAVGALINPAFKLSILSANAAIRAAVDERRFALIGTTNHQFRIRLASPAELRSHLNLAPRPSRFPPGGRKRLDALWRSRPKAAQIEVIEYFTVFALRSTSGR
jgi:hypothetical protein